MTTFLKKIILFLFFFVFLYSGFLLLWGLVGFENINLKYTLGLNGRLHSRITDISNFNSVDILFIGSSHTYRGFDPRIFQQHGIKTFNLGSSAQTPIQTQVLLKRYLNQLSPKIVVYEVYPETFTIDGVESAVDLISNDKIDFSALKMAFELNNVVVYNTLIYKILRNMFVLDKNFHEPLDTPDQKDKYVSGGFVEKELKYYKNNEKHSHKNWVFLDFQKNAFEQIVDSIKKQNIKIVLVQAPITHEFYSSILNNAEIDSYFANISDYYDFNNIIQLSSEKYFYDDNHLNQEGVKIFNEKLISLLIQNDYLSIKYQPE